MNASAEKYLRLTFALVAVVVLAGVLLVPLYLGVWPPDVFIDRENTLAEERLASGHLFRVVQYWGADFYTTELQHTAPDGSVETHILDPDDSKSWCVPLEVYEEARTARITLSGGRVRNVDWR